KKSSNSFWRLRKKVTLVSSCSSFHPFNLEANNSALLLLKPRSRTKSFKSSCVRNTGRIAESNIGYLTGCTSARDGCTSVRDVHLLGMYICSVHRSLRPSLHRGGSAMLPSKAVLPARLMEPVDQLWGPENLNS
ncbi:hypothetical protein L9F63_004036, partial [Diploptera punctata]